jgi:hypothetical protein
MNGTVREALFRDAAIGALYEPEKRLGQSDGGIGLIVPWARITHCAMPRNELYEASEQDQVEQDASA